MPSYHRIPAKVETTSSTVPDEDDPNSSTTLLPAPYDSTHMVQRKRSPLATTYKTSILILLTGIFILLARNALALRHLQNPTAAAGFTKKYAYGHANIDSLSHAYDEIYTTKNQLGVIELPPYGPEGESLTKSGGGIGMFHQLHCLDMIRMGLQKYSFSTPLARPSGDDKAHWSHCLEYLRFGILCSADPTIELPRFENGSVAKDVEKYGVDGVRDVRVCRNAEPLYEMTRQHGVWRDRY